MKKTTTITDLYNSRVQVGERISEEMAKQGLSQSELCRLSGISRPTLVKILDGTSPSKTTYDKQIEKVLQALKMSATEALGGKAPRVDNETWPNALNAIRRVSRMSIDQLSEYSGISKKRIKEIENGAEPTDLEAQDLAWALGTGARSIKCHDVFPTMLSTLYYCIDSSIDQRIGAFWGHVGIQLRGHEDFLWYPISNTVADQVRDRREQSILVVPCMNNRLLYINMKNVKELQLLPEGSDEPGNCNWDPDISEGEIPAIFYEYLREYVYRDEFNELEMSSMTRRNMKAIIDSLGVDVGQYAEQESITNIYYEDGTIREVWIDFEDRDMTLDLEIEDAYCMGEVDSGRSQIMFTSLDEATIFINRDAVSMMEMPLVDAEGCILEMYREIEEDLKSNV